MEASSKSLLFFNQDDNDPFADFNAEVQSLLETICLNPGGSKTVCVEFLA